jgi:F-type H+-transporting ATPase subunit delta
MANVEATHETVLDAGTAQSRLARVYAAALLAAAEKESPRRADEAGAELAEFVRGVASHPDIGSFLTSPAVGKKKKAAALEPSLRNASELLRGLVGVLTQNNRLDLLRNVAAAYQQLLDQRAGRVPVKVTAAVELTDDERNKLAENLRAVLRQEPVLNVRIDPDLLGGLVVQVGDTVIDTSVRSRLQSLRSILLAQ